VDKTKILTTLPSEVPADDPDLLQALELIKPANCLTRGTTYLGSPFGCRSYVLEQLDLQLMPLMFPYSHTSPMFWPPNPMTLFTKCLQATVPHLLATDVLLWVPGALHPIDPYKCSSPFVSQLNALPASFLAYITGQAVWDVWDWWNVAARGALCHQGGGVQKGQGLHMGPWQKGMNTVLLLLRAWITDSPFTKVWSVLTSGPRNLILSFGTANWRRVVMEAVWIESPPEGGRGSPLIWTSIVTFAKSKSGGLASVGERSRNTSAGHDVGLQWAKLDSSVVTSDLEWRIASWIPISGIHRWLVLQILLWKWVLG